MQKLILISSAIILFIFAANNASELDSLASHQETVNEAKFPNYNAADSILGKSARYTEQWCEIAELENL